MEDQPLPLHRPHELVGPRIVEVCQHCWDLATLYLPEPSRTDVPEPLLWPCATAERTLDLLSTAITADMIERVAVAAHALGELEVEPEERMSWEDLGSVEELLDEAALFLTAIRVAAGARILCCDEAYICPTLGQPACSEHAPGCCDDPRCPGNNA